MIASRPLTIAEIFDRTVTIIVRRWRVVVAFAAIDATPSALVTAFFRGHDQTGPAAVLQLIVAVLFGSLAFSPLVRLGADPDPPNDVGRLLRLAVHDYGRSLGSWLLSYAVFLVVLAIAGIIAAGAALGVRLVLGPNGFLITAVVGGLMVLAVLMPLFLVTTVAYANVVLECVGPWRGLTSAAARIGKEALPRTCLLGAALLIVSLAPVFVVDSALRPLVTATGMWWILLPEPYLVMMTGAAFAMVAGAVAAVDYRNRREGADLHAVLDAAPSGS